jgi:hypothetical protein
MVASTRKVRPFFLAGGLGNQLFQIAAAIDVANNATIELHALLNNCRVNLDGEPELASFVLPKNVNISKNRYGRIVVRVISALLSLGLKESSNFKSRLLRKLVAYVASFILFFRLKKFVYPVILNGVGFDQEYTDKSYQIPIGYMQSYKWHKNPKTKEIMMNIRPVQDDYRIKKYEILAAAEKPIIIHYRFGDYVGNVSFGRPQESYYLESLESISQTFTDVNIWVFSDDMAKAKLEFPVAYKSRVRWIEDLDDTVAATFEVMRLGHAYVIANSTFSWWAAYLNHQQTTVVYTPKPWFRKFNDPYQMCPVTWKEIAANFKD